MNNLFDASIYLALFTALVYYIAYQYNYYYFNYYGLSEQFINDITIPNIIVSISILGSAVFFLVLSHSLLMKMFTGFKHPILLNLLNNSVIKIYIVFFVFYIDGADRWLGLLLAVGVVLAYDYLMPLLIQRDEKGYINKLQKNLDDQKMNAFTLENLKLRWNYSLASKIILIIFVFLLSGILAQGIGNQYAKGEDEYLTLQYKEENYFVVNIQDDTIVVAPININDGTFKKEFIFLDIKEIDNSPIVYKLTNFPNGITEFVEK